MIPPDQYLDLLVKDIELRHSAMPSRQLTSLYFGGGTPSLFSADQLIRVKQELEARGFTINSDCEITLEINPATLDKRKIATLIKAGFNRYSVGAQSFEDSQLKSCGREHNAAETLETLSLLRDSDVNFSLDLLYSLPNQTLSDVKRDAKLAVSQGAKHISAYSLTVPQSHPMSRNRAPEGEQIEMFNCLRDVLTSHGYLQYEISNFAKPGFESKHNLLYWRNSAYWGIGLSAHSYLPNHKDGLRFWNPKSMDLYIEQLNSGWESSVIPGLPLEQMEMLTPSETLTDICHMYLRTNQGLPLDALHCEPLQPYFDEVLDRFRALEDRGLVHQIKDSWCLTPAGQQLSNQVFLELTFLSNS